MSTEKKPKWDIGVTIDKGNQSIALTNDNLPAITPRLQSGELEQLKANVAELQLRRSGQTETMVGQKSKTLNQNDLIIVLRDNVSGIRNIVKNNNTATAEIQKSFGIGEHISTTVTGVTATANIVITAYEANVEWSNKAGIIEDDISNIRNLISNVTLADDTQENAKYVRHSKTMDKNQLQRAIEDEVSRISSIGAFVFGSTNPALAAMFDNLIPSSSSKATEEPAQETETK